MAKYPIDRDHSSLVKFSEDEDSLDVIFGIFRTIILKLNTSDSSQNEESEGGIHLDVDQLDLSREISGSQSTEASILGIG
jgi:hypothetical protein